MCPLDLYEMPQQSLITVIDLHGEHQLCGSEVPQSVLVMCDSFPTHDQQMNVLSYPVSLVEIGCVTIYLD